MSGAENWLLPGEPWSDLGGEEESLKAALRDKDELLRYLEDVRSVITTPAGLRLMCSILERLRVNYPCWSDKNPWLARNAVLRDFGQELLDDIAVASPEVHDAVQRSMRIRRKLYETIEVKE